MTMHLMGEMAARASIDRSYPVKEVTVIEGWDGRDYLNALVLVTDGFRTLCHGCIALPCELDEGVLILPFRATGHVVNLTLSLTPAIAKRMVTTYSQLGAYLAETEPEASVHDLTMLPFRLRLTGEVRHRVSALAGETCLVA